MTFKKIAKNTYGFAVGEYDKKCELIIDPVVLAYSTYLGGSDDESCKDIAIDNSGNAYVTGYTYSTDFPIMNQYQGTLQGYSDAIVAKIDTTQSGTSCLIYSTYLGGDSYDDSGGIAVDNNGNAYITGTTVSPDFPILNQYQSFYLAADAFVTKLFYPDLSKVTTALVSSITATSAEGGGEVISDGGAEVTARGVCWSTSENPTTDDNHTTDGSGTGVFISSMTDLTPNTLYYVRAYATNSVGTAYGNEETFETNEPSITVTSPNGGENWKVGSRHNITWTSDGIESNVMIEYSTNNGGSWKTIVQSTENDGDYDWTVPDEPSETCLVRISETDGQPVDISDAVFSIVQPLPGNLTVLTPNGGENLETGSEYNISWTGSGLNNVIIEYSVNNGGTWLYIEKVPADDGSYTWIIPGTPSDNCLVRVSGADSDENPSDISDGVFTIFDPTQAFIEVFTPNGGENLSAGTEYYITWASAGINNVIIEYSTDNGDEWIPIDTVSAIGGRFTWTVPGTPSDSCLVRISGDDSPEDPSDMSDGIFSITNGQ